MATIKRYYVEQHESSATWPYERWIEVGVYPTREVAEERMTFIENGGGSARIIDAWAFDNGNATEV